MAQFHGGAKSKKEIIIINFTSVDLKYFLKEYLCVTKIKKFFKGHYNKNATFEFLSNNIEVCINF